MCDADALSHDVSHNSVLYSIGTIYMCIAYSGVIPEPLLTHVPSRSPFRVYFKPYIYILMHVRWQSAGTSCMCWKPLQCISINVLLEVAAQVCAILCLPSLPPLPHIISFTVAGSNCMNAYSTGGCPKDRPVSFCCWLKNGKVHKNHLSIYIRTKCMHPHMR